MPYQGYTGSNKDYTSSRKNFVDAYSAYLKKSEADRQAKEIQDAQIAAQKASSDGNGNGFLADTANNAVNLGKGLIGGAQQALGTLADIGIQGGTLLNVGVGKSDAQVATLAASGEKLRQGLHSMTDINGNPIGGTSSVDQNAANINAGKGTVQDYAAVAGKALETGVDATMLANPASLAAKSAGGATAKVMVGDVLKSSGLFGGEQGVSAGLQDYGKTGDVGSAIKTGAESAVATAGANLLLGGTGAIAGKIAKDFKAGKTTPVDAAIPTDTAKPQLQLGAGFRDTASIEADIKKLQDGTDPSVMDVTTSSGQNFTVEDIAAATQKQTELLTQQRDILNTKLAAQDNGTPMYENTVKQIDALDQQIKDVNANGVTPTGEPAVSTTVNAEKLRAKFSQLQQEADAARTYNENIQKAAAGDPTPARTQAEIKSEATNLQNGKVPAGYYNAPTIVTSAHDVAMHPTLPEPLIHSGNIVATDKAYVTHQLSQLMTPEAHDAAMLQLDNQYTAKIDALKTVPEPRQVIEKQSINDAYMAEITKVKEQMAQDAPKVQELQNVLDKVNQQEQSLVSDVNGFMADNFDSFKQVDQTKVEAKLNELKVEEYTTNANPAPAETATIIDKSIQDGVKPSESLDPMVTKAVDNTIDTNVSLADNTGKNPGVFSVYAGVPRRVMATWGSAGKRVATVLADATDNVAIADNHFSARLQEWSKAVGGEKALNNVAKALDGNGDAFNALSQAEMTVYHQSRDYLNKMADNIGLPQDSRLSDYFPHLFTDNMSTLDQALKQLSVGKDMSGKELSASAVNKLQKTISGIDYETLSFIEKNSLYSVKNGFLEKRTGATGYSMDFADTMNTYSHAANRTTFMKPALAEVKDLSASFTTEQNHYLAEVIHAAGGRPTDELGSQLNATLEGITGRSNTEYSQASAKVRTLIYNATMGLNPGSALRNFSQQSNIFAKLGSGYYASGFAQAIKSFAKSNGRYNELVDAGVLHNRFSDLLRSGNTNSLRGKADKAMWGMFTSVEQLNRATAYFGAKAKALAGGATEEEARLAGRDMSRTTQFEFGVMDRPIGMQSTTAKNIIQFQSYNTEQVRFIANMFGGTKDSLFVKNATGSGYKIQPRAAAEMARYVGFNLLFVSTIGTAMGMKPTDMIPFFSEIQDGGIPKSPLVKTLFGDASNKGILGLGQEAIGAVTGDKTAQSNLGKDAGVFAAQTAALLVPAGSQAKKMIEGANSVASGQSENASGKVRFLQNQDTGSSLQALLFGQYATKNGQDWLNSGMPTLTDKQTAQLQGLSTEKKQQYYDYYTSAKKATGRDKAMTDIKDAISTGNINGASKVASEYNATVDKALSGYWKTNSDLPLRLKDEMTSSLYIDVQNAVDSANKTPSAATTQKQYNYLQNDQRN